MKFYEDTLVRFGYANFKSKTDCVLAQPRPKHLTKYVVAQRFATKNLD
jgi:hypothetical protein